MGLMTWGLFLEGPETFLYLESCSKISNLMSSESRKTLEQKFIFQIGTLNPTGINERFSFY